MLSTSAQRVFRAVASAAAQAYSKRSGFCLFKAGSSSLRERGELERDLDCLLKWEHVAAQSACFFPLDLQSIWDLPQSCS